MRSPTRACGRSSSSLTTDPSMIVEGRMTSEGPQIRQAEERDFPEIADIHYRVWRHTYAALTTPDQLDMFNPEHSAKDVYPQMVKAGCGTWVGTLIARSW